MIKQFEPERNYCDHCSALRYGRHANKINHHETSYRSHDDDHSIMQYASQPDQYERKENEHVS